MLACFQSKIEQGRGKCVRGEGAEGRRKSGGSVQTTLRREERVVRGEGGRERVLGPEPGTLKDWARLAWERRDGQKRKRERGVRGEVEVGTC